MQWCGSFPFAEELQLLRIWLLPPSNKQESKGTPKISNLLLQAWHTPRKGYLRDGGEEDDIEKNPRKRSPATCEKGVQAQTQNQAHKDTAKKIKTPGNKRVKRGQFDGCQELARQGTPQKPATSCPRMLVLEPAVSVGPASHPNHLQFSNYLINYRAQHCP